MNESGIEVALKTCLSQILPRYPVKLAYLYGSSAAGNATPLSDVDIALVLADMEAIRGDRLILELQIEEEISRSCRGNEIDVRVINSAPLMVRGEVITKGVLLYSVDEAFRVEFETSTRSAYFDFMPTATAIREAYFDRLAERGLNG